MLKLKMKPIAAAVGTAFAASVAQADTSISASDLFAANELQSGYNILAQAEGKCGEGKCGEGKCGEGKDKAEGKCGEGKCGEGKDKAEGKCGEGKCGEGKCGEEKSAEGKCGEGKCGGAA